MSIISPFWTSTTHKMVGIYIELMMLSKMIWYYLTLCVRMTPKCVLWQTVTTQNNETFHQGLNCFIRQTLSSEKEIQFYLEIITCDP